MARSADFGFLEDMGARAEDLAKDARQEASRLIKEGVRLPGKRKSKDYWAKPFYSDVSTFRRGVPRVFIGINSKGDRRSLKYDEKQRNEQRVWSGNKPLHNAYLDERWGSRRTGIGPKGQSSLQVATQRVFKAIYRDSWKRKLRKTPCFNLVPVSSHGVRDPVLEAVWSDGVEWGIELIEYLNPKLIVLYGNAEMGKSVWAALTERFSMADLKSCGGIPPNYRIEIGVLQREPLTGVPALGLPHLSMADTTVLWQIERTIQVAQVPLVLSRANRCRSRIP